jgi:glutamate N-acetyltransferase/amino-acid N-acetyltransferase
VLYDQALLAEHAADIRAIVVNAGNANACTGPRGMDDARQMAALTAYGLRCQPDQVLVLSTGVIGRHLDMDKLTQGIAAVTSAAAAQHGAPVAARAIMTTDTRPKVANATFEVAGRPVVISGMCKGSGMIHPNMATMLAIVTTDAAVAPALLRDALRQAAGRSFNCVSVDGDMSTNDTLLLLASGASEATIGPAQLPEFAAALTEVCIDLARQVARDGEGATRLIEIRVAGAADEAQAHTVGDSIARSPLFKCAVHGGDPNWGRVLCAAGYSGAEIDADKLSLSFGAPSTAQVHVVANGLPIDYVEQEAAALLREDPVYVNLDLGLGQAAATVWTCDFSKEYVEINAHYTT